jgi:hypothetical protein
MRRNKMPLMVEVVVQRILPGRLLPVPVIIQLSDW